MDIKKLIGETTEYDKKQAVEKKKIKSWCKSVGAFANTFGGSLVFGISNDDEIVGIIDGKGDSEFISQKIKERISPIPAFNLRFEVIDGKELIIVDVMAGKDTPFYYVGDGTTEAYIRVGNESVIANAMELKRLVPNLNYNAVEMINGVDLQDTVSKTSKLTKNALEKALENEIVELMRQEPKITQVEIAEKVGLSRSKVQSVIKRLLESDRIERTGGRRYGRWFIKE